MPDIKPELLLHGNFPISDGKKASLGELDSNFKETSLALFSLVAGGPVGFQSMEFLELGEDILECSSTQEGSWPTERGQRKYFPEGD